MLKEKDMLKLLRITNIILVESVSISFVSGLNILTGETGSGKSAIMAALGLIVGDRSDPTLVRHGSEKGLVEALFDISHCTAVGDLLEASGINHDNDEDLVIRREIRTNGKSRAFINDQPATLQLLKKIGEYLLEMVGQHANQRLFNVDYHRRVVDLFGGHVTEVNHFAKKWEQEHVLRKKLQNLIQNEAGRLREIEAGQRELEELQEAALKEGEEEELFQEFSLLNSVEERSTIAHGISQLFNGDSKGSAISLLSRTNIQLEQLLRQDTSILELSNAFKNAFAEIQEVAWGLDRYMNQLEYNPQRLAIVNERLTLINQLKRKYGTSLQEIATYKKNLEAKLASLENTDQEIELLKQNLDEIVLENGISAANLSAKRKKAMIELQKAVTKELQSLNMPKALFEVSMVEQETNPFGSESIEFFLLPNTGERKIALKEGASGGEISRVLLAIQTLLAGKEAIPTLIFDEVDANIGGETAVGVGLKLKEISQRHQVLCITHFSQVAEHADHHLQISKIEQEGRTLTQVQELTKDSRNCELSRMTGQSLRNSL